MAPQALVDIFSYVDGYDFTCDTNKAVLETECAVLDKSTFCSRGYQEVLGGVKTSMFNMHGFWQGGSGQVDPEVFPTLGTSKVHTFGPADTAGTTAYLWRAGQFNYKLFEAGYGEIADFDLTAKGTDGYGVVKGLLAAEKQSVSGTGVLGSVLNLGDPTGKYVYASLHVFSAGTTISVQVQSDTAAGFGSATTIATFSGITTVGGNWMTRVAGVAGETHYRLNISACTGTFSVAGAIAVQ